MTFNHLVLIGGGHSNVSLLKKWLMFPKLMPEIPVSIISRDSHLVYSATIPIGDFKINHFRREFN